MRRSYGPYQRGLRSHVMYEDLPFDPPKPVIPRRQWLLWLVCVALIAAVLLAAARTRLDAPPATVLPPLTEDEFAQFIEKGEAQRAAAISDAPVLHGRATPPDDANPAPAAPADTHPDSNAASGAPSTAPQSPADPTASAAIAPQPVSFVDAHVHAIPGIVPAEIVRAMDNAGVQKAVLMPLGADEDARKAAEAFPGRFIPFAGGASLARLTSSGGAAWNLTTTAAKSYVATLEAAIARGEYRGIGELLIAPEVYADAPLVQALMKISGQHQTPLVITLSGTAGGMTRLARALNANPTARVIWAGCGSITAEQARRMLATHPNLWCDLSSRDADRYGRTAPLTDRTGKLTAAWKSLLEAMPERFMVGTDARNPVELRSRYAAWAVFHQRWLGQLSDEAAAWVGERTLAWVIGE